MTLSDSQSASLVPQTLWLHFQQGLINSRIRRVYADCHFLVRRPAMRSKSPQMWPVYSRRQGLAFHLWQVLKNTYLEHFALMNFYLGKEYFYMINYGKRGLLLYHIGRRSFLMLIIVLWLSAETPTPYPMDPLRKWAPVCAHLYTRMSRAGVMIRPGSWNDLTGWNRKHCVERPEER